MPLLKRSRERGLLWSLQSFHRGQVENVPILGISAAEMIWSSLYLSWALMKWAGCGVGVDENKKDIKLGGKLN